MFDLFITVHRPECHGHFRHVFYRNKNMVMPGKRLSFDLRFDPEDAFFFDDGVAQYFEPHPVKADAVMLFDFRQPLIFHDQAPSFTINMPCESRTFLICG
jgi:hypothetical protein